jgi:transposase
MGFLLRHSFDNLVLLKGASHACQTESECRGCRQGYPGQTRRKFTAEEKIQVVLEGLKGEASISELCRREGIVSNLYYRWSKDFLEAGKKRLQGDTVREASSTEAVGLRQENEQLKQLVAELSLKYRLVKKSLTGLE